MKKKYKLNPNFTQSYLVYILELQDSHIYVGTSKDLKNRLKSHIKNNGSSFSKLFPLEKLLGLYKVKDRDSAYLLEMDLIAYLSSRLGGIERIRGSVFLENFYTVQEYQVIHSILNSILLEREHKSYKLDSFNLIYKGWSCFRSRYNQLKSLTPIIIERESLGIDYNKTSRYFKGFRKTD